MDEYFSIIVLLIETFPGTCANCYICPFVLTNVIIPFTASRCIYNSCSAVVSCVKQLNHFEHKNVFNPVKSGYTQTATVKYGICSRFMALIKIGLHSLNPQQHVGVGLMDVNQRMT